MQKPVEVAVTRGDTFLRAVIFLKHGKENFDAPVSVVFSGSKDHIFIPAPNSRKIDPVYPERDSGQFVHRIEKGIYHATLFGKKGELSNVKSVRVFAGGEEQVFDMRL